MMRSIFGFLISPLFVLFVVWPQAWAQLNSYSRSELAFDNALSGSNPGFESGTVKWTASGGTFAVNSGTQFVPGSKQFASWDSNSASQEVCSSLVKVPESGNCSVGLEYRVPSGTATHKIVAKDGSKDLAIEDVVSSTSAMKHEVEFPCASAASNQARVCLRSVASNEPAIQFDSGYAGYARNVGVADTKTEWVSYTPVISNLGTGGVASSFGKWRQNGPDIEIMYNWTKDGSGGSGATTVEVGIPSVCKVSTSSIPNSQSSASGEVYSSLSTDLVHLISASTGGAFYVKRDTVANVTGADVTANSNWRGSFRVPCVGWTASNVVMPDAQGWWAAGYISGASVSLGTTAVTTYQEATNGSLTLTPDSGSAPMGITCSSTNAAATPSTGATTCSAGNESLGFSVNVPRAGRYEVCGQFGHNVASSAGDAGINVAFEWVNTATNSQTIVARMGPRTTSGHYNNPASGQSKFGNVTACGQVTLSAGVTAFRLFYEQSIPGANGPSTNVINIDADPNIGDRAMRVTMRPITGEQQAILANSVSTPIANGLKVATTRFTTTTGPNACAVSGSIDNSWISGTPSSSGAGQCSFTMASGYFSAQPDCQFTVRSSPAGISVSGNTSSATAGSFQIWDAGGMATAGSVVVTCIGPR